MTTMGDETRGKFWWFSRLRLSMNMVRQRVSVPAKRSQGSKPEHGKIP